MQGRRLRVQAAATAFGLRRDHVLVEILASFVDHSEPLDVQRHRQWVQTTHEAFGAMALPGGYPNLLGGGNPERAAKSHGSKVERLIKAKRQYDPDNIFCSAIPLPSVSTHWPPNNPRAVGAGRPAPCRSGARATRSGVHREAYCPSRASPKHGTLSIRERCITIHHVPETWPIRTVERTQSEAITAIFEAEHSKTETKMLQSDDNLSPSQLDYDEWREMLRSMCGRYNPEGVEPNAFAGWVRPVSVCGFTALNIGCNAHRVERTCRDARLDGVDHYFAVFQVGGQSAMAHNDQAVRLAVGDVAFVDAAQPVTYFADNNGAPWNTVTLNLPRQSLVSHLGFEPKGGLYRRGGTPAGRLLFDLIQETDGGEGSAFSPADSYMQLAVYDLVGALFAPSDPWPVSRHADKLFTRISGVIKDRFADPDFGPCEVAAEAGISLRYLQKLFTQRGSTCSEFIYSLRLDHAARLLHRRAFLATNQPVSEIAYASGFRDYTNFARKFRHRFGRSPCAYAGDHT